MAMPRGVQKNDDWNLPLDELDPCCQKEIENNKHHARVGDELRQYDRSQLRLDEKNSAILSLRAGKFSRCQCCETSMEYPLLAEMRRMSEITAEGSSGNYEYFDSDTRERQRKPESTSDSEDSDSEIDSDDELLMSGLTMLTPIEQERMYAMKQAKERIEGAQMLGFAQHVEDGVEHISQMAQQYRETIVLHVYVPSAKQSALLDLTLEKYAKTYVGTRFRRVCQTPDSLHGLLELCAGPDASFSRDASSAQISNITRRISDAFHDQRPFLLVLSQQSTLGLEVESDLGQFFTSDGAEVMETDLIRYLDNAHALHTELQEGAGYSYAQLEAMKKAMRLGQGDSDGDSDDGGERFESLCGMPGCDKRFHHSHIGAKGGENGQGVESLVKSDQEEGVGVFSAGAAEWGKM